MAYVNGALGVFNLIPAFPLDGGRLLRAALWGWKGTLQAATYLASRVGVVFAFALMVFGVFQVAGGAVVSGFWLIFIGLFLRLAADAGYTQLALRETLAPLRVSDVMSRDVVTVAPETTLEQLAERFWTHRFTSFPVASGDRVVGIVHLEAMANVARAQWAETPISAIMRPLSHEFVIAPHTPLVDAMRKASSNGLGRLAVLEGPRLVGYLSLKDIRHVLILKGLPAGRARPRMPRTLFPRRAA